MTDRHQLSADYDHQPFVGSWQTLMLATTPRSGSHYLGHLITANKGLGSPLEYFNEEHFSTWSSHLGSDDPSVIIDKIRERRTGSLGWFSFKAHWPQFKYFQRLELNKEAYGPDKIVFLKRKDVLSQAVSWAMAKQTKKYIHFHKSRNIPHYRFQDIASSLHDIFFFERCWEDYFIQNGNPEIILYFEDILTDPKAALGNIYRYLGFDEAFIENLNCVSTPSIKKQGGDLNARWKNLFLQDLQDVKSRAGYQTQILRSLQRNAFLRKWVRPIFRGSLPQ